MATPEHTIEIADHGRVWRLNYSELAAYHGGGAVFGAAVGFRMLQLAARALSENGLWDRKDLAIVSYHPGAGVRDAVEFVTRCVTRGRYESPETTKACHDSMRFEWRVSDGRRDVSLKLRDGFVPGRFFELAGRKSAGQASAHEEHELEALKVPLSELLWEEPLEFLFHLSLPVTLKEERAHA